LNEDSQEVQEREDTILTDCLIEDDYCILMGDEKINGKYRILLAKMSIIVEI